MPVVLRKWSRAGLVLTPEFSVINEARCRRFSALQRSKELELHTKHIYNFQKSLLELTSCKKAMLPEAFSPRKTHTAFTGMTMELQMSLCFM